MTGDTAEKHLDFLLKTFYPKLQKDTYPTDLTIYTEMAETLLSYVSEVGVFEDSDYEHARLLNVEYPMSSYDIIEHARLHVRVIVSCYF